MDDRIVEYVHHGNKVKVRKELKGHHRRFCLCHEPCAHFKPGEEDNCPIARELYKNCVKFELVTPVWECPKFEPAPVEEETEETE